MGTFAPNQSVVLGKPRRVLLVFRFLQNCATHDFFLHPQPVSVFILDNSCPVLSVLDRFYAILPKTMNPWDRA